MLPNDAYPSGVTENLVRRTWVVEGLPVCTCIGFEGTINGYVRLPATGPSFVQARMDELRPEQPFIFPGPPMTSGDFGFDHRLVLVNGGWNYGPDPLGWIGFDTNHGWDLWDIAERKAIAAADPVMSEVLEIFLSIQEQHERPVLGWEQRWTETRVEQEVTWAARELAALAHRTMEMGQDSARQGSCSSSTEAPTGGLPAPRPRPES